MYILVYYDKVICNLPTHDKTPFPCTGVLNPAALEKKKESLTEIINALFDGKHNEIFGSKKESHMIFDRPESVILSAQYPQNFHRQPKRYIVDNVIHKKSRPG